MKSIFYFPESAGDAVSGVASDVSGTVNLRHEDTALAKSSWLVLRAIKLSKSVLLPMLQAYEKRHELTVDDVQVGKNYTTFWKLYCSYRVTLR